MTQELEKVNSNLPSFDTLHKQDVDMIKESNFDSDTKAVMLRAIAIRFCDLSMSERVQVITTELEQAYIRNGIGKDEVETKAFTVAEIVELFNKRKQITHKEITHIFKQGSLGLYGKNFGINVKSIHDWIVAFYDDEQRKLAVRKLNELKKASEAIKELTPAEKESIMVKMVKEIYFDRKENGFDGEEMLSYPIYDILKIKGLIKLSDSRKKMLLEEAEDLIKSPKKKGVNIGKIISSISFAEFQSDAIKVAKVLAVRDYFNELSERNMDLPL